MTTKIGKEFHWQMSHRLPFHQGLCKNIHGHTYKMIVEIEGETDKNGMVMDYYNVEKIVGPIINELDHSFICDNKDNIMLDFLKKNNFRYVVIQDYTTAENIAEYLLKKIKPSFSEFPGIKQLKVRLFETDDAFAEVQASPG